MFAGYWSAVHNWDGLRVSTAFTLGATTGLTLGLRNSRYRGNYWVGVIAFYAIGSHGRDHIGISFATDDAIVGVVRQRHRSRIDFRVCPVTQDPVHVIANHIGRARVPSQGHCVRA
jgi:hypothetical protein